MENDNKRKRPSQGLIDMMNGGYEKLEEERMKSFSYEPKYNSDDGKLNISVVICSCENNDACTKEEDGNGEWKDYCWKCKCFRN
jgi:hypothetical protein